MKHNQKRPLPVAMLLVTGVILSGCGTSKEALLPAGQNSMLALWQNNAPSGQPAVQGREALRRPLTLTEQRGAPPLADSYSRTQESEISQQFPRLPNPDMVMYVFPHLAGGTAPVTARSFRFIHRHNMPCRANARSHCNA